MEANRIKRAIRNLKRDSLEKDRRIVRLERSVNHLVAYIKNQRRRRARPQGRPVLLSSTEIISPIDTGSSTGSSFSGNNPSSMAGTSASTSDRSQSTGQQPSISSSNDSTPSDPIGDPETPGGSEDEAENNSWATLTRISFQGDSDLEIILTELRKLAMDRVKLWSPTKPEILAKKARIVKWILKPDNIHKFTTLKATFSTSRVTSMWRGLVDELFPEIINTAGLITYFGNASRSTHFFGEFVQSVVSVHQRSCRSCAVQ